VWTMASTKDRFTGAIDDDRDVITGHWDALERVPRVFEHRPRSTEDTMTDADERPCALAGPGGRG
jgi:hypothetical protein